MRCNLLPRSLLGQLLAPRRCANFHAFLERVFCSSRHKSRSSKMLNLPKSILGSVSLARSVWQISQYMLRTSAELVVIIQEGNATIDYHTQSFSTVPVIEFPGGTYKSSNTRNFPASYSMSASLIYLVPGGMREPHWHAPNEWAFVINGTCRCYLSQCLPSCSPLI